MKVIPWDGRPISAPGLYSGVPMEAYHGQLCTGPSVSRSSLWRIFQESPRHYWIESYLNPRAEKKDPSTALAFGSAAHHCLLGEEAFNRRYVSRPARFDSWRTADSKAWKAEAEAAGLTVLIPEQIDMIRRMAESLAEEPLIKAGILNGLVEHTMVYQDKETGVWIKVRPDCVPTDGADISDLKTIADITDDGIEKAIGDTGLNMQGAMVGEACREVLGVEMASFNLVFAEKTPPNCIQIKTLTGEDLELGERQVRASLRMFKRCLDANDWPGPGGRQRDATYTQLKPWARKHFENRIKTIEAELEIA